MKYTVIIETGQESGYVAHVPSLRGCVSQGGTREQALANVKEAIEAYIEALLEDGIPVPWQVALASPSTYRSSSPEASRVEAT